MCIVPLGLLMLYSEDIYVLVVPLALLLLYRGDLLYSEWMSLFINIINASVLHTVFYIIMGNTKSKVKCMLYSRINGHRRSLCLHKLPPSYWTCSLRWHLNSSGSIQSCCAGADIRTSRFQSLSNYSASSTYARGSFIRINNVWLNVHCSILDSIVGKV